MTARSQQSGRLETPFGKTSLVTVMREGKEKRVSVTLTERPEEDVVASAPTPETDAWLGIHVEDARSGDARRQYSLDRGQAGVVELVSRTEAPPITRVCRKAM
jgi:hypothetical protein